MVPAISLGAQSVIPNSRNECPDIGQKEREQQSFPRFLEGFCEMPVCVIDGPWFAQGFSNSRV